MGQNTDLPPSYDEVIREDTQGHSSAGRLSNTGTGVSGGHTPALPSRPASYASARPTPAGPSPSAQPAAIQTGPRLPWTYPPGFYCSKCGNTGYKIKSGRSCKRCWRRFAPTNSPQSVHVMYDNYYGSQTFGPFAARFDPRQRQGLVGSVARLATGALPVVVRPGDPRIGGVVCGQCRGTGLVRFFLDEELCPLCNGVGRIV
ncbi:LAMI_0F15390g1_1 [Lachancea mirantina]|uniref:LAMI_0F15390g1_1 n=1 Tax=Lachancea mirantina TaxID=1230905 RepID=A0A1G4K4C2_9SACH|nr:LAMI_0F15390g1_1 [Lachancea mirantina]